MEILDLTRDRFFRSSCARVVSVSPAIFLSEFRDEQRSDANPVPTTDDLMLNKQGVPLGNLRNVVHALREQGDGCL